jgi:uncharacterized protein YcbK (DUF882 family)
MKYHVINLETNEITQKDGSEALDSRYPNLLVKEFACQDGSEVVPYNPRIVLAFQRLRYIFGPLEVNSGFRTYTHNAKKSVGGAINSQHLYGKAIDIDTPDNYTDEFFMLVARELFGNSFGYGLYKGRIHVDCRGWYKYWDSKN